MQVKLLTIESTNRNFIQSEAQIFKDNLKVILSVIADDAFRHFNEPDLSFTPSTGAAEESASDNKSGSSPLLTSHDAQNSN